MALRTEQNKNNPQWLTVHYKETKWNSFYDAEDIEDSELADVQNIDYASGYPQPRKGSTLAWDVPTDETNDLLCSFAARASDGTNYALAIYAPDFYLRDETNNQWVKLNSSYSPSATYKTLMYGYRNWNAGISSDVLYAGNGTESCIKWQIAVGYLASAYTDGDLEIVLDDASKFPSTGTIVIKESGGSEVFTTYSAKSTNTLTVADLDTNIAAGACVTFQILEAADVAKGKIFSTYLGRLIVANQLGGESTLFGSEVGDPEEFTPGTAATEPFLQVITDGNGGIVGVDTFGEYLVVEKEDSFHKVLLSTTTDSSGASYKRIDILPVGSDIALGPVQPWARFKKNNLLYFATSTEGIYQVNPDVTGSQMSIKIDILSKPITPFVNKTSFTSTRTTSFDQKILFSATSNSTGDIVLVYDLLREAWSKYTNWNVKDWLIHNKELYYGSRIDNKFYKCFTDSTNDNDTPYDAYCLSKEFDFGIPALPKTLPHIFVWGYITPVETIKFDVILRLGDQVITVPYQLKGNGSFCVASIPKALAMMMLGVWPMGNAEIDVQNGIFRAYLALPLRYGFYTAQIKTYSRVNGTYWGLMGMSFAPISETKHSEAMTVGSVGDENNID